MGECVSGFPKHLQRYDQPVNITIYVVKLQKAPKHMFQYKRLNKYFHISEQGDVCAIVLVLVFQCKLQEA